MSSQSVLNCPWCSEYGAEVAESAVFGMHGQKFAVYCNACFCEGPPRYSADEAITAWNTRATAAPVVVGEDMAREVIDAAKPFLDEPNPNLGGGYLVQVLVQASVIRRLKAAVSALTAALAGD